IVLADTDTLADCIEAYFLQSEQLATRIWLAADGHAAAGMLLQQLPGPQPAPGGDEDGWQRAGMLAATLTAQELLDVEMPELVRRLFHEESLRLADRRAVAFRCSCDRQRVEGAL